MPLVEKFAMPNQLLLEAAGEQDNYAKFIAEPLEKGFGHTLGNALRRVLLSSLEGIAISSVRIDGVSHEFSTMPDVVEDVTEIVLNFKKVLFQCSGDLPRKLELRVNKIGQVTAGDITADSVTRIVNPEQPICTLDKQREFFVEMEITKGRGFRVAEENKRNDQPIGVIPVDCLFSPVTRVAYSVHDCRVGQRTDYDKVEIEVWTDGRIKPSEAIKQAAKVLIDHLYIFIGKDDEGDRDSAPLINNPEDEAMLRTLLRNIHDLELSVRSQNCLNNADIKTLGELVQRPEAEMLKYRNFGQKSLTEIREKLAELGLSLSMEVPETVRIALERESERNRNTAKD